MNMANMFFFRLFFILCLVIFCNSCKKQESKKSYREILFFEDVIENKSEIKLSEIASGVEYFLLENREDCLIETGKAIFFDDYIVVADFSNQYKIIIFDKNGKFVRKVGSRGRGPGEFIQLKDIVINSKNNTFYVLANPKSELLEFNLLSNIKRSNIPINGSEVNLEFHNGYLYTHTPSNQAFYVKEKAGNFQFSIRDMMGRITAESHPINSKAKSYMNPFIEEASFSINSQDVFYHVFREYYVYKADVQSIAPQFFLDFGKYAFPENYEWTLENTKKGYDMNKVMVDAAFMSNGILFINFRIRNKNGVIMHNFGTDQSLNVGSGSETGFIDDIDGLGYFSKFYSQKNKLISLLQSEELLSIDENKFGFSPRLNEIRGAIDENSNIIIRVITLK